MKDWMQQALRKPWSKIPKLKPLPGTPKKRKKKKRDKEQRLQKEKQEAAHRCRAYLAHFWPRFELAGGDLNRLELLRRAAHIPGWPRVSHDLNKRLRHEFRRKAHRLLSVPIEKCATCEAVPREKHHIVPLCFGGINEDVNLVLICIGCHDFIHPWMKD